MPYVDWEEYRRRRFHFIRSASGVIRELASERTLGAWLFAAFIAMWFPVLLILDVVVMPLDLVFNCLKFGPRRK
jgi:hypothetical protein